MQMRGYLSTRNSVRQQAISRTVRLFKKKMAPNRQHHTGKVSIEYKQDSTKRAQSKYRRRETLIKKIQEFSEITSIEATVVFRDSEKLYVDGPDDDMNASVENFLKRPEKKSSSAQYEISDLRLTNQCLLCGEKKNKDVLCCALPKCAKVVHTTCLGIVDVKAKALDCITWQCPSHT
ncbi:unnamed protein product [Didymodactylos carnosus]|uniref:MADS-box domain-containing protein n=1 Tax=Didymodactylos carnosus TaxID=1234261 RepID=A0A8S2F6V6_9BILA|nr:unnamed protein product [Didymodactylos carnosus]CAF4158933.1 unnamed protein product [Didymodactylos carnosus]